MIVAMICLKIELQILVSLILITLSSGFDETKKRISFWKTPVFQASETGGDSSYSV